MADYTLYKSIITQSIQDFNKIQNELATKAVTGVSQSANGFTPTAELSELVRKELVKPTGTLTLTDTNIGTDVSGVYTVKVADDILTAASGSRTGYLNVSFNKAQYTVDGNKVTVGTAGWAIAGSEVTSIEAGAIDAAVSKKTAPTAKAKVTSTILTSTKPSGTDGTDFWTFTPSLESKTNGSVVYNAKATKAGYITASTIGADKTEAVSITEVSGTVMYLAKAIYSAAENTTNNKYIISATAGYQPAGSVYEVGAAAVKATITGTGLSFGSSTTDGYALSASKAASGNTAGYISNALGSVSGSAYIKKGAVTVDLQSTAVNAGTRDSTSGTTVTFSAAVGLKPVLSTEGYVKSADISNQTKTVKISVSDANLIASNIKQGVTIFGVAGSYLAPSIDGKPGSSSGAELRYINLTDHTSESGVPTHTRHSYHMLAGAVSYIDNQPVYGSMADYTVATTETNTYGAKGSGTILPLNTATLDANYVTASVNISAGTDTDHQSGAFVNEKTSIQIAISSIAESVTKTLTAKSGTISPSTGKLLTKVEYTVQSAGAITHAGGGLSFTNSTTATAENKGAARITNSSASNYVTVTVNRAAITESIASSGWVDAKTNAAAIDATSSTAYIPASVNPSKTGINSSNATSTVNVGSATQFNATDGTISTAGAKSGTGSINGTVSGSIADLAQTYLIGNVSLSGTVSGTATANINADSTGANVDKYLVALYKRQLGVAFTTTEENLTTDTGVKLSELY